MAEDAKAKRVGIDTNVRDKNLTAALGQIEKEFGKGAIMKLGDNNAATDVSVISTGALSLDIALGIMGVPRGRIVEIFGPESSGKTTLCMHIIANAQRAGGVAAIIDAEHAVDPVYASKIGVNVDNLLISQPDCGEDALNIADMLIRSNAVDVLVIDSVAALVPRAEIEGQKEGDEIIATGTKVKVVKNKLAPPFRIAEFDINWNEGISRVGSIIDVGTDLGVIEKRGSWFSFNGEQLAQGREQAKTVIGGNKELEDRILKKIRETLAARRAAASGQAPAAVPAAAPSPSAAPAPEAAPAAK